MMLCLPTVSLPIELENALKKVLDGESYEPYTFFMDDHNIYTAYPAKRLVSDGHVLYRHLLSRKSISRVQESKRRRGLLRTVPGIVGHPLIFPSPPLSEEKRFMLGDGGELFLSRSPCNVVNLWSDRQHHDNQETVESVLRYDMVDT